MKTALIILNYNNADDTRNCIKSILAHNSADIKIIVVDNDSSHEQRERLQKSMQEIFGNDYHYYASEREVPTTLPYASLIETGENLGYAKGNNVALRCTYTDDEIDYVMILNNDILFVDDIIPSLLSKHKSLPDCAIISPVLYKKDLQGYDYECARRNVTVNALISRNLLHYVWKMRGKGFNDAYPDLFLLKDKNTPKEGTIKIELPSGSCMLIRKDYFKEIGSFDPNTFLYYEENILYEKIRKTGHNNYLSLEDKCIHLGAATMQSLPSSAKVMKESRKSECYYVSTYSEANKATKILHRLSTHFFMATFRLQKALTRK